MNPTVSTPRKTIIDQKPKTPSFPNGTDYGTAIRTNSPRPEFGFVPKTGVLSLSAAHKSRQGGRETASEAALRPPAAPFTVSAKGEWGAVRDRFRAASDVVECAAAAN